MEEISQTFDRGLTVLEAVDSAGAPIGVRELARQLGLGATIVQRLVSTLERRGFVEQVAETRRYRIGHRAIVLGQASRHGDTLTKIALAELEALAEDPGLNGYMGVLSGGRAVYVLAVPSRHRVMLRVDAGETMPFHSTTIGKVFLAAVGEERARQLLGDGPLKVITDKTVTDPDALIAALPAIREHGYARVDEENIRGIVSVGAPIRNAQGKIVAGLSVAFTKGTTSLSEDGVAKLIVETADRISRAIGCPADLRNNWTA
jgi:DNA-binding IclR family transcriptional regulator